VVSFQNSPVCPSSLSSPHLPLVGFRRGGVVQAGCGVCVKSRYVKDREQVCGVWGGGGWREMAESGVRRE